MAILNFQKPDKVIMIDSTDFEGKFEFRPLEPGYGLTVGNALRRVLLSSLEGFAIGYGILTVENYNQALIRSKTIANKSIGKGKVAALACINQMSLKAKYTDGS